MVLMACAASQTGDTLSVATAPDVHGMAMSIVSLPRKVPIGMAIHATRMPRSTGIIDLKADAEAALSRAAFVPIAVTSFCFAVAATARSAR
jgi:hypothetical protein